MNPNFIHMKKVSIIELIFYARIDGESLKSYTLHWPMQRWQEYEPLLSYCRDNGVRLLACGTPPEVSLL